MFLKLLLLVSSVWFVHSLDKIGRENANPVYLRDLEYIVIDGYHGAMDARTLELFDKVETLVIQNCNFTTFNENYAHSLKNVRKLTFSNSHFDRVKSDFSTCCKRLREVELINSNLDAMDEETMKKISFIKALERIYMLRTDIPVLHSNSLAGSNLKELEILHSNLATIEDGAFNGMEHLEVLNLQRNQLKSIPTTSLAAAAKTLKELNLEGNHLEKVTAADFPSLPNLEKLDLGHNPIKEINLKGLKEKMPNIKRVVVSGIDIDPSDAEGIPLLKMMIA